MKAECSGGCGAAPGTAGAWPAHPDPARSRPQPAATRVSAPERGQAVGTESPPPSTQRGLPRLTPSSTSRRRSPSSPTGAAPPRADTHNVVTAEATRTGTDGHTAAFSRQPRAEHARTPKTQGPVWAVTPAINRSLDPALSRVRTPRPLAPGPPPRPAPAREFPAFPRVMLPFRGFVRGARSRESRARASPSRRGGGGARGGL